jgi:hypothetical protein
MALSLVLSMLALPGMAQQWWILTRSKDLKTGVTMNTNQVGSEEKHFVYLVFAVTGKQLDCFVDGAHGSSVKYRFESDDSYTNQKWNLSRNGTSLFYPGDRSKFFDRVCGSKKLEIEFQPSDSVPQTRTFRLTGFPVGSP